MDFGEFALPYGIFSTDGTDRRVGVAIGTQVLDLAACWEQAGRDAAAFRTPSLNAFMASGRPAWDQTRTELLRLLAEQREALSPHLVPAGQVHVHLPIEVADYIDFYASEEHATNLGKVFRPNGDPLTPNWKHLPIGYHGRSGTVVVSGTAVTHPSGQLKGPDDPTPTFGLSRRLDIETELGWIVGTPSTQPVPLDRGEDHLFGAVILNDWSARDIQAWEYVPLGPFLGKSFATSISAWVLPMAALTGARVDLPPRSVPLLDYLAGPSQGFDITIEVEWNGTVISHCPAAQLYWSPAQMIAHLTVNGATMRTGDLFGSGTISGPAVTQRGSLLELTWNGTDPVQLQGEPRTYLRAGDEIVMRAQAPGPTGTTVALGECRGTIR